jgi:hypothetical protein
MPQQAQETVNVRTPGGKVIPILKSDLATAIKRGAIPINVPRETQKAEEEGTFAKVGRGTLMGAAHGLGIPETQDPVGDLYKGAKTQGKEALKNPDLAPANATIGMAKQFLDSMKEIRESGRGGNSEVMRWFAGGKAPARVPKDSGVDVEQFAHGLSSIATQLAMLRGGKEAVETPISEGIVAKGAKGGSRELLGIGEKSVGRARKAAEGETAEKVGKFEKAKAEREAEVAEQKAEKEKRDAQTLSEHKGLQEQEKARARGEHEAAELKRKSEIGKKAKQFQRDLVEKNKIEASNAKIETARKSLDQTVQQKSKAFTDNMNKVIAEGKKHFDQRYGEFDEKILGKSEAFPKGTAESDLSAFANAVENAKKNLIEGSPEKIKQFENVIKLAQEGDEFIDAEGGMKIAPGQKIPTVDLRGFVTELDSAIYGRDLLPDVRNALKSVAEAGKTEVLSTVKRIGGETAVKTLKELNADYSDYLTDWRDTSSVNPLPKLRNTLLEGVVQKNPAVLADLDVAKMLQGSKGQTALTLLDKYKKFGADPSILADYRKALDQIKALDKMKKVPEVEKPEYPERITKAKINPPKPPEIEPFKARGKDPERPETKPFDPESFRKEKIGQKAESLSNLSMWDIAALSAAIEEVFRGKPGTAAAAGSIPVIKRLLARGLSSEGVQDWLAKDKEGGAPPPPAPERRSPSNTGEGPGGMDRRAAIIKKEVLKESIANAERQRAAKGDPDGIIARQIADFREMLAEL